jgi:lipid-binding SYLF domain-containing protein
MAGKKKPSGLRLGQAFRLLGHYTREREHALVHQLLDDADALAVLPHALRLGVDPGELGEGVGQALQPFGAGSSLLYSTLPPGCRISYGLMVASPTKISL